MSLLKRILFLKVSLVAILYPSFLFLRSCGSSSSDRSFNATFSRVTNKERLRLVGSALSISSAAQLQSLGKELLHSATIEPIQHLGRNLHATSFRRIGATSYAIVTYNFEGEEVYGGFDIINLDSSLSLGKAFFASDEYEFADVVTKGSDAYLVGQKRVDSEGNTKAVVLALDLASVNSPHFLSELTFDGHYATSIALKNDQAFITIPDLGVKVIDIADSRNIFEGVFKSGEVYSDTPTLGDESPIALAFGSVPAGFSVDHYLNSDWNSGHAYQIRIFNNSGSNITDWKLCFNYDRPVGNVNFSNARISSNSHQPNWEILPEGYNQTIYNNSDVTFQWQSDVSANGEKISNILLKVNSNATTDCDFNDQNDGDQRYLAEIERPLFVDFFGASLTTIGGSGRTELINSENLASELFSVENEAPTRFFTTNGYLYTNAGESSLNVFDSTFSFVSNVAGVTGRGNGISGDENLLFAAQGDQGLFLYDIRNKEAPAFIDVIDFDGDAGSANNVSVIKTPDYDTFALLADGLGGVKIIKVE